MISSSKRPPRKVRVHVGNSTFTSLWSADQAWTERLCSRLGPALGCGGGYGGGWGGWPWGRLGGTPGQVSAPCAGTSGAEQEGAALGGAVRIFTRYSGTGMEEISLEFRDGC